MSNQRTVRVPVYMPPTSAAVNSRSAGSGGVSPAVPVVLCVVSFALVAIVGDQFGLVAAASVAGSILTIWWAMALLLVVRQCAEHLKTIAEK